jgi:hypothetical protein
VYCQHGFFGPPHRKKNQTTNPKTMAATVKPDTGTNSQNVENVKSNSAAKSMDRVH